MWPRGVRGAPQGLGERDVASANGLSLSGLSVDGLRGGNSVEAVALRGALKAERLASPSMGLLRTSDTRSERRWLRRGLRAGHPEDAWPVGALKVCPWMCEGVVVPRAPPTLTVGPAPRKVSGGPGSTCVRLHEEKVLWLSTS